MAAGHGDASRAPPEMVAVLGDSRLNDWLMIGAVAFAPDGTLHSAAVNGALRQWDVQTGELVAEATQYGSYPAQAAFSQDCSKVAVMSVGKLHLVDRPGRQTRTISGIHHAYNLGLSWSPDGTTIAKGNADGTISLFAFETGSVTVELTGHDREVRAVAFSADGTVLASTGQDGTVRLWPLDGGEPRVLYGHTRPGLDVAFTTDGSKLVSASEDRTLRVWSIADGTCLHVLRGHVRQIHAVAIAPNQQIAASTSAEGAVKVWDLQRGVELNAFGVRGWPVALEFSPDGTRLAQTLGGAVLVWDPDTGSVVHEWCHGDRCLFSAALTSDGQLLAFAGGEERIQMVNVAQGEVVSRLLQPDEPGTRLGFTSVALLSGSTRIAAAERTGIVRIWDRVSGELQAALDARLPDQIFAMAISPEETCLAACGPGIYLWNLETGALLNTIPAETSVTAAAFTPNSRTLVTGGQDHQIKLWDAATGRLRQTLAGHCGRVMSVAVSPDGRQLASVAFDQQVRLWDLATGDVQFTIHGHRTQGAPDGWGQFASVAFSPDGSRLASSAYDGTVRLWNPRTGAEIKSIRLCQAFGIISHLTFTADGRHLLTANGNGTVYVLRVTPQIED